MRNTSSAFQELHTQYLGSTVEIVCFHVGGYKMGGVEGNGRKTIEGGSELDCREVAMEGENGLDWKAAAMEGESGLDWKAAAMEGESRLDWKVAAMSARTHRQVAIYTYQSHYQCHYLYLNSECHMLPAQSHGSLHANSNLPISIGTFL